MNVGVCARVIGVVGVVAALCVGGCDESSGGGPPAPTDLSVTAKSRLTDYCAKRETCRVELGVSVEACPTSMCLASNANEAPLLEFFDCQLAKPCAMFFSDDDCVEAAGAPDAAHDAFLAKCNAKAEQCRSTFGSACPIVAMPIINTAWVRMFDACLDRPCAEVDTCWAAADALSCW